MDGRAGATARTGRPTWRPAGRDHRRGETSQARQRLCGALHRAAAQCVAAVLPRRWRQSIRTRADVAGHAGTEVMAAGDTEAAAGTCVVAACRARQARRVRVLLLPVAAVVVFLPPFAGKVPEGRMGEALATPSQDIHVSFPRRWTARKDMRRVEALREREPSSGASRHLLPKGEGTATVTSTTCPSRRDRPAANRCRWRLRPAGS